MELKTLPIAMATVLVLLAGAAAQDSKPDPPKPAAVDPAGPGCIVIQPESTGLQVVGMLFGGESAFEYLYSANLNGVKSIDRYQREVARSKGKSTWNLARPEFNLATLTVWNWGGLKIIPLAHKHTDAELQAAIAACDAFVAEKAPDTR